MKLKLKILTNKFDMRIWRNWQTRKTKDLVGNTLQVQILLSAPTQKLTIL